ncbi:putative inorganic phosphate cotransporter [Teleopsis dalmanni]|uniref:putative inorganic phosphate cotransporter n=1 Tax=Teleopsis dalmanni TaxID=139649 RepID=UPI0018CCA663|nr:putative inorganic phosphate cotransporter [Teleopsis dalmanni]
MAKNRRLEGEVETSFLGVRHIQCLLLFSAVSMAFATRVNLSISIVAMTDEKFEGAGEKTYDWNEKIKSVLLSSFFWGYILTQFPAGLLARKFGGKNMLLYGIFISSILTLLTPWIVKIGNWQALCVSRIVQGISQGVIFPTCHTILSQWAPLEERGLLGTLSYSGSQFGTVVMLSTSGVLISKYGWPSVFYIPGFISLLWVVVYYIWGASTPKESKSITAEEKELIETSIGSKENQPKGIKNIPWLSIFTSVPFWMLFIVHCSANWGFWTLLIEIPSYLKNMLGMDIKSNALLSALPYTVMFFLGFVFSGISKLLNKYKCLTIPTSRKVFNTIGFWIPMITLFMLGYIGADNINLAVTLLTITVGLFAATFHGFQVNHMDLSPNYAGVMMGITNLAANVMSLLAPLTVGFIVTDVTNPSQWRIIFFIAAIFYFIGNLLFIVFGKATVQTWNNPESIQLNETTNKTKTPI